MTNVVALATERAAPRKRDAEATRSAILAAGKTHFARSGYEGAYLRDIAADAGADAALINRYFGGKEGLFNACLREAVRSEKLFDIDRGAFGDHLGKIFAAKSAPESDDHFQGFRLILRAATSTATAHMLNEAVQERFMGPIRHWLGGPDVAARARLISALFIGFLVEGLIRDEPLDEPERTAFAQRAGAILQSLVDG